MNVGGLIILNQGPPKYLGRKRITLVKEAALCLPHGGDDTFLDTAGSAV